MESLSTSVIVNTKSLSGELPPNDVPCIVIVGVDA